jgi:hypothetical protein
LASKCPGPVKSLKVTACPWLVVLLRIAYLSVTNALAMLRLLGMSDHAKDSELLALRHQITVLQRQLHGEKVRFDPSDRGFLAVLLHRLPRDVLLLVRLLVRPESAVLGFEQFGLPTVVFGVALAYSGAALYALRVWQDRRRSGNREPKRSLHATLTGATIWNRRSGPGSPTSSWPSPS